MTRKIKDRINYTQLPDATPESELDALVAVYAFVLEAHARKNATKQSSQDEPQGDKEPPLQPMMAQEMMPERGLERT